MKLDMSAMNVESMCTGGRWANISSNKCCMYKAVTAAGLAALIALISASHVESEWSLVCSDLQARGPPARSRMYPAVLFLLSSPLRSLSQYTNDRALLEVLYVIHKFYSA